MFVKLLGQLLAGRKKGDLEIVTFCQPFQKVPNLFDVSNLFRELIGLFLTLK